MIKLKLPANIGGRIKLAGELVAGLTSVQEKRYIDAGTAEYPSVAAIAKTKQKPEVDVIPEGYDGLTNAEIDAKALADLELDTSLLKTKREKLAAVSEEIEKRKAVEDNSVAAIGEGNQAAADGSTAATDTTQTGDSAQTFGRSGQPA